MKPVIVHDRARAELDEAIAYYERQQPGLVSLNLPWVVYEQDRSEEPAGEAAAISRRHLKDALGL